MDWDRKWLVDLNAGKTHWFHLTVLIILVLLIGKWMVVLSRENRFFKMLGLTLYFKLDWGS